MSQENVEFVRAMMERVQHPDALAQLAAGERDLALLDPEIEWDASRLGDMVPDLAGVYWGHEGVRVYWTRWFEAWKDLEFEVQDVRDAGAEVVVLIHNQHQWGLHSGISTELPPWATAFTVRDGKVVRARIFPSHESALKAVGLEE